MANSTEEVRQFARIVMNTLFRDGWRYGVCDVCGSTTLIIRPRGKNKANMCMICKGETYPKEGGKKC